MNPETDKKINRGIRYNPENGEFEIIPEGCKSPSLEEIVAEMVTDYGVDVTIKHK